METTAGDLISASVERLESRFIIIVVPVCLSADKIKELLKSGTVTPMTRLALVNAIYFKGDWLHKFKAADTKEMPFKLNKVNQHTGSSDEVMRKEGGAGLAGNWLVDSPLKACVDFVSMETTPTMPAPPSCCLMASAVTAQVMKSILRGCFNVRKQHCNRAGFVCIHGVCLRPARMRAGLSR